MQPKPPPDVFRVIRSQTRPQCVLGGVHTCSLSCPVMIGLLTMDVDTRSEQPQRHLRLSCII